MRGGHADGGKQEGRKGDPPKGRGNEPKGRGKDKPAADKPARKGTGPAPQAKAGKTTICHATGSATNPYVLITVSDNALKAHAAHQDGRDIIPAPAGGCPGAKPAPEKDKGKTPICHATGSATNPYVLITVSDSALKAHAAHQDGRDIIPAPAGGCPAGDGTPTGGGGSGGGSGGGGSGGGAPGVTISRTPAPGAPLLPPTVARLTAAPEDPARGPVLGAFSTGGKDGGSSRRESGSDLPAEKLPFTGFDLLIVLALGLGTLSAGVGLHRWLARDPA